MLILRDGGGRLLLQRRPPTGVWAGLWSLPEADDVQAARRGVARRHGLRSGEIAFRPLAPFMHTFSHYRLEVTPLMLDITTPTHVADAPDSRWLHPLEAAALGLPAPVRKLINHLAEES